MHKLVFVIIGLILVVNCTNGRQYYGRPVKVPTNDPTVRNASEWAVKKLDGHLKEILSAERQLVAGLLYIIKLRMSKNSEVTETCVVKVWDRAWLHERKLLDWKCESSNYLA